MPPALPEFHSAMQYQKYTFSSECTVRPKTTILTPLPGTLKSEDFEKALAAQMIEQGRQPQTYRFFIDDSELIHANGKTYAATKMWGHRTTLAIDELLKAFPGHRISYKETD